MAVSNRSDDCVFCKIIAGEIPVAKVYEDADTFAFLDAQPVHPGHTLVLPKAHYKNVFDIPEQDWLAVMRTVRILAPRIKAATNAGGINIILNNEAPAHQEVFHSHTHLIPRYEGDGLESWHGGAYDEAVAKELAEKISNAEA